MKKEKIQMIIDIEITPYLETHNGGVEILEFNEKINKLSLRLSGKCCTCSSALGTIENLIKRKIYSYFSDIDIVVETGVSNELLEIAKKYLRENKNELEK